MKANISNIFCRLSTFPVFEQSLSQCHSLPEPEPDSSIWTTEPPKIHHYPTNKEVTDYKTYMRMRGQDHCAICSNDILVHPSNLHVVGSKVSIVK